MRFIYIYLLYMPFVFASNDQANLATCENSLLEGNTLEAMKCFERRQGFISQLNLGIAFSFVGMNDKADELIRAHEVSDGKNSRVFYPIENIVIYDAVSKISELAADKRVVMLNESHHQSAHRHFALQLARGLRERGFTHIAIEALSQEGIADTVNNGYATYKNPTTGFYTSDPAFAFFIRESIKMGFVLYAYEAHGAKSMEERENTQAVNLQKLLVEVPEAKVFVYAGYGHIRRGHFSNGLATMANLFQNKTGIQPLLIDQVGGTHSSYPMLNDPVLDFVSEQFDISKPSILQREKDHWLVSESYKGDVDITVFHPKYSVELRHESWINHDRFKVEVDLTQLGVEPPIVVRAISEGDREFAVPIDKILIRNARDNYLFLPAGSFRIDFSRGSGFHFLKNIEVGAEIDRSNWKS
ncbi:hypothetical protein [Alkalimonas sp.]|uniref:hypothetical protein n=1 Tax=Alkalimonas sp. TaxID=1872453 RepID=UPI00263BBA76|nr:hypothetical protein [Alkalimonas sp.]MCC5827230.1 hypothetical protein [Alkalimonas sp.]